MSTTFGIKIDKPYLNMFVDNDNDGIVRIAFRSSTIRFTNPIAHLLPEDTPVIPLDNTAQGIKTIGDIKKQIEKESNGKT